MWDFEYETTGYSVIGILPSGEKMEFATVDEYREAYTEEENDIYDGLAELYCSPIDYPDDYENEVCYADY